MKMIEVIRENILNEKLEEIRFGILERIDEKVNKIHFERWKCCKQNNEYDTKLKNDYEKLLKLKRKCISSEEFKLIDDKDFENIICMDKLI